MNTYHKRVLKGSREFQKEDEKLFNVKHIKVVDQSFLFIDQYRTVRKTLEIVHEKFNKTHQLASKNEGD